MKIVSAVVHECLPVGVVVDFRHDEAVPLADGLRVVVMSLAVLAVRTWDQRINLIHRNEMIL